MMTVVVMMAVAVMVVNLAEKQGIRTSVSILAVTNA